MKIEQFQSNLTSIVAVNYNKGLRAFIDAPLQNIKMDKNLIFYMDVIKCLIKLLNHCN